MSQSGLITEMREISLALLTSFTDEQNQKAKYPFSDAERVYWYYAPINRHGLPLRDMTAGQRNLAMDLLRCGLSERGAKRAEQIIQHEVILGELEKSQNIVTWERDTSLYFFTIFGDPPQNNEPWGWRAEGHHLSIHVSIWNDEIVSLTPSFFGANPAKIHLDSGECLEILAERQSLALELINSLGPAQVNRAVIFDEAPADILTFSAARASLPKEQGLSSLEMGTSQRRILKKLISQYTAEYHKELSAKYTNRWTENFDNIHFAWGGGTSLGTPHYYRLHGGDFFVEYDNIQNDANHIHSVWRDLSNDFGTDVLREHLLLYHIT